MGLKCSLFGHAFDERDVVRERDSTGSEVVTVVKDVERCTQCGTTRVVSTNKEVVSAAGATADGGVDAGATLHTPGADTEDDTGGADAVEAPDQLGAAGDGPGSTTAAAGDPEDDGGLGGGASGEADDTLDDTEFETPADDPTTDGTTDAADEDATILSDDGADNGTPDGTTVLGDAAEPTDPGGEGTETVTDDAEILTDDGPADRAPGRWPGENAPEAWEPEPLDGSTPDAEADTTDDDEADADGEEVTEDTGEAPGTTAEPAPDVEPAATASFTVPDGHYRCGECGHTIPASSSFRRGDTCPECVHGYLEAGE